jgi:hypothetical protein
MKDAVVRLAYFVLLDINRRTQEQNEHNLRRGERNDDGNTLPQVTT